MKRTILAIALMFTAMSVTNAQLDSIPETVKNSHELVGKASYYGNQYKNTRQTANGEHFNKEAYTAAHKTLPFGSVVKVTNLKNNKSVTVRINDRGPFIKGRIIDLSKAAARQIGCDGICRVTIKK